MHLREILRARQMLRGLIWPTPLLRSPWLSEHCAAEVYLKLENLQITGSFKVRGALYKLKRLGPAVREREILTVSAGNHGRAVAYGAELFHARATIIVPRTAAPTKIEAIARHRVSLLLVGEDYDEAEQQAREMAARSGALFISPYNDPDIICGQGTIALEMLEALPQLDALLVPTGGGGLLAGVALAARALNPRIAIFGVQSENSPAMYESFRAGHLVTVQERETLADGLAGNIEPDSITFPIIRHYVDDIVLVSERAIREAIVLLLKHEHHVVEGAGAVGVAALLESPRDFGRKIGVILTGSNIDLECLTHLLTSSATGPATPFRP
jgi:threonine dehydratase